MENAAIDARTAALRDLKTATNLKMGGFAKHYIWEECVLVLHLDTILHFDRIWYNIGW